MTTQVQVVGSDRAGLARRIADWARTPVVMRTGAGVAIAVAVVFLTGGPSTIGFWFIAAFGYGLMSVASFITGIGFLLLVPLMPIFWILNKLMPGWADRFAVPFAHVMMLVPGALYFLYEAPMEQSGVRLPTMDPNLGAVIVMVAAALVWLGISKLASRLEHEPAVTWRARTYGPGSVAFPPAVPKVEPSPEPDDALWSPEPVTAWRVWQWTEEGLRGFRVAWRTPSMVATCATCPEPPGWGCSCGIYAVKDRSDLMVFGENPTVVGRVEMWGTVVEHRLGYRASHARVTDLWVESEEIAARIAAVYPDVRLRSGTPSDEERD